MTQTVADLTVWAPTVANWAVASAVVDYEHIRRDDETEDVEIAGGVRPGTTSVAACFARGEPVRHFHAAGIC